MRGWAQSSLPGGSVKEGSPVWPQLISGAQFPAHSPHSTLQPIVSTLCCCTRLRPTTASFCTPLIKLPSCTEWEHIMPQILLPYLAGQLCARHVCPAHLSSPFEKSLPGHSHCSTEPLPRFPHTTTLQQVKSLSLLWPVTALLSPSSRCSQNSPLCLALSWSVSTTQLGCTATCVHVCSLFLPSNSMCSSHSHSWPPGLWIPCPGRGGSH